MKTKALALSALLAFGALSLSTDASEAHGRRGAAVAAGVLGGLALGFGAYAYGSPYYGGPAFYPGPVVREYYWGGNNYYYGGTYCCDGPVYREHRRHRRHRHHD